MKSFVCSFLFAATLALGASNPVPFVNQPLVPASAQPGGPAFTLTVNGIGFVDGAVVNWNNSPRVTKFVSASQVTAEISAFDIETANTAAITVTNKNPGGGISNVTYFTVNIPRENLSLVASNALLTASWSVLASDFNGDGKPDIALLASPNLVTGALRVLLGGGTEPSRHQQPYLCLTLRRRHL